MNCKRAFTAVFLAFAMLLPSILTCASIETLPLNGPITEDLLIYFYSLPSTCYQALKVGAIDIMAYPLTENQYLDAIVDPDIVLASHSMNDIYGFPFNLNETIKTYSDFDPVLVSPMTYLEFRQAIAHLIDKDYIVDAICGGFAKRIDVPVPYAQKTWWNTSVTGDNYPY